METETDGEDCGGPEPARNSDPDRPSHSAADDKMLPASEPRTSWEGEPLRGLEEADIIKFPFSPVSVKSEEDDEEKPQSPQLHQRLTEQMETETDGEDCGGPEPARNSDPDRPSHSAADDKTENSSDPETDDSCDWEETREPQSGSNSLQKHEVPGRDQECSTGTTSRSTSECAANSGHKGRLQKHNGCQKGEKPFSCSVCGKRYTLKSSLTRHMILHSEEKVFSCSVCKNTFLCREEFKKHMKIHKRKKKQYSCSVCGKRFSRRSQFKKHQCVGRQSSQVHQGQTEETRDEELVKTEAGGEVCGGLEPARNSDTDLQPSTNDKTSPFSGPRTDLEENREPQSGSNPVQNNTQCNTGKKPFSCAECGKLFCKKSKMKTHMKNHTRDELFSCSVCSKVFNRRIHLKEHKATHTKDYNCSVCGKRFTRRSKFIKHQCVDRQSSQLHQGLPEENRDEELVKAEAGGEDCGGLEPARNSDTDLQSSTNDKTSPFSGPRTDLEENREPQSGSNPVQNNTQCNTGKKPFSCAECGKLFCKKSKMKTHMKNHTRDELFSCSVCSKVFNRRIHLKEHKATHTKDYNCSVCGKRFTRRSKFKKHQCVDRQSSQLHQGLPEENRDEELVKAEAGGEDCGGLEPVRNLNKEGHLQPATDDKTSQFSEPKADLEETREPQSGSNPLQSNEVPLQEHIGLQTPELPHIKEKSSPSMDQEDPPERPLIKEEQDELWTSQEGKQLQEHQRLTEHMETKTDGDDCGGPEPARNSDPDGHFQPEVDDKMSHSEPKTDDSCDWEETREPQSGSKPSQNNEVPVSDQECSTVKTSSSSSECATSSGHKPNEVPVSDQECSTVKTSSSSSECATSSGHKPNEVPVSDQECSTVKTPSSSSECATSSGRKGRLQKQNKVQQEMPFTCSVCGKGYLGKNSLTGHMRIHREVKDFSCSDCDKKFHSRNSLSKHKKNDHAGEMPFTCYICGKRFVLQKQLSRHMNVGLHLTVLS
ncbi:zinc finger protein 91-like [Micropterus salmoides]|uniref:zinc finger protein 91-like n=1 Tax=Micropterus salmoides TaxID=27706 RepID=UPI0018EA65FE|nr:zinc finger protein 91-like [Micropterus salmoides]